MELRELRYFLALVQEQNFSKAAEFLHTTQPNLSRQIQNMEDEIGQKLIVRGKRQITLTDAGITLRKRAQEIVELYERTENELKCNCEEIKGLISIGGGETYLNKFITDKAKSLRETYPDITFSFTSQDTQSALENLDKGLVDLAIVVEPVDLSHYNFIKIPGFDSYGVLMTKDSPLASKKSITVNDLTNLPLIVSRHMYLEKSFATWFKKDLSTLNIVANYNLIYNAALLVESGVGYAITFANLINTADSNLVFVPLEPAITTNLDIAWKKYQKYPKYLELFIDMLTK